VEEEQAKNKHQMAESAALNDTVALLYQASDNLLQSLSGYESTVNGVDIKEELRSVFRLGPARSLLRHDAEVLEKHCPPSYFGTGDYYMGYADCRSVILDEVADLRKQAKELNQ
jgi:hypothetical protein